MKKFLEEFKAFALKGNVMDLAVAVIIGAAFQSIINSVVNDLIMPLINWIFGGIDFTNKFIPLKEADYIVIPATSDTDAVTVATASLAELEAAGIGAFKYGSFITSVVNFLLMALTIFLLVKGINKLTSLTKKQQEIVEEAPTTKKCPFCCTEIDIAATRCPHCTSELPEEDKTEE